MTTTSSAVAARSSAADRGFVPAPGPTAAPRAPAAAPGGLLTGNAPPPWLPAEHFAAALVFWLAGAAGLVWVAPDLAAGAFPVSRVVAVAHLFTLGWITTSIQGALYQFLPVALGVPIRSRRAAHAGFVLYVPGLALFVGGLAAGSHPARMAGAALFGTALLLFIGNLAATLRRAPERTLTWWALTGAASSLLATVALGISLAGNLHWGYLGANRFAAVGVHLHVAVAGWVMMTVVGVAHRLLPMFLLSHGAPERPAKVALALLAAGVAALLALHHALTPTLKWTVAALLAGGLAAFLVQAALFFRHRRKPALDPGLRLAAVALSFLGLALGLAPVFLARGVAAPRVATAYGIALVLGGLSLFVAGHYYKILPFLVWFHRFGPLVGKQAVPRVAELYSARTGEAALALLAAGTAGLAGATLAGAAWAARPAALVFAAGAVVLALQMLTIVRTRPA
ncbi:MAG TPA: hypothetical protein VF142_05930 [Longimicrobium sp.]